MSGSAGGRAEKDLLRQAPRRAADPTSWYSRGFNFTLSCTERRAVVINALLALMTAIIVIRRLIREAWTSQRGDTRPARRP